MSQETLENQQNKQSTYQDTIATEPDHSTEKKSGSTVIVTMVGIALLFCLLGVWGGLICLGGCAVAYAIDRSGLPLLAKIILGIIVVLICLILLGL